MSPEQRERVKQDLFEMLQLPQEAWSAALDATGSTDPVVRTEVERLLQLGTSVGHFLEGNAVRGFGLIDAKQLIGSRLKGRYLIEKYLGEGGFGVVFLASDSVLDSRPVVVKMLHSGVFTKRAVQKEIRSLAAIDHPGVVGILDAGDTDDGRFFVVLRYIAGPTLREVFNERGKLPIEHVERLTHQLTEALSICHDRNILHLDLKPENILLKDYGLPSERGVIVDFGTAETLGKTQA
ncbi:MAG TPA: serine/threonine-protein kinase, partial [Bryobacteraceae bacterium]|nr:serine/threonine-protein kinase [Bryobacteraceae bacterium]